MAKNTANEYRNLVLYSVYVRNHSEAGTFEAVRQDLERIKALGTDMIWLMPIHPIGQTARKGTLGSPYAISDYRTVNPEYGTLEDLNPPACHIQDLPSGNRKSHRGCPAFPSGRSAQWGGWASAKSCLCPGP